MTHRGAVGSDARDGDGAGVMTSMPHKFFVKNFARETGFDLPPQGQYAAGNLFFKPDTELLKESTNKFEEIAESLGLRVLGWREVPRDTSLLGPAALSREPLILQPFVVLRSAYGDGNKPEVTDFEQFDDLQFERQLYVLRKRATHTIGLHNWFYLCSLSNKILSTRVNCLQYKSTNTTTILSPLITRVPQLGSCPASTMGSSQW